MRYFFGVFDRFWAVLSAPEARGTGESVALDRSISWVRMDVAVMGVLSRAVQ